MSEITSAAPSYSTSSSSSLTSVVLILFAAFFVFLGFLGCCTFYVNCCVIREPRSARRRRSIRTMFAAKLGLDKAVLDLLPIFEVKEEESGKECAVCLSEFRTGEQGRILPNCNHSFHTQCIDAWFECHVTCPLCRCNVSVAKSEQKPLNSDTCSREEEASTSSQSSPQNSEWHVIEMVPSSPCSFREENSSKLPDGVEGSTIQKLRRLLSSDRRGSFSNQ